MDVVQPTVHLDGYGRPAARPPLVEPAGFRSRGSIHNINGSDLLVVRPEATIAMSVPRAVQHPIRRVKIPCHVHHRAETNHVEKLLDMTLG